MAYGIEIWDDSGNLIFEEGKRYLKVVGYQQIPAQSSVTAAGLAYSFELPPSVPLNETVFAFGAAINPPASVVVSGRRVVVERRGTFRQWNEWDGSVYDARATVVYFGYYA